jgi:hypothetical protein
MFICLDLGEGGCNSVTKYGVTEIKLRGFKSLRFISISRQVCNVLSVLACNEFAGTPMEAPLSGLQVR